MKDCKNCPGFIADILRHCKTNPSRTAVIDNGGRRSTYGELYDIAKKTSGYIRSKGIAPGSFILIHLPNCMEYLSVELGIWLSGCAIVPMHVAYPKARIDYISSHCKSPLLVDGTVLQEILSSEPLEICETTADIAALYYTSGSTGNPKGVIHTFETIGRVDRFKEILDVVPDDCFASGAPLSFIAGLLPIAILRSGATYRFIDREVMLDIRKLQTFFDNDSPTCAFISPSVLRQLDLSANRRLRLVLTGTERVSGIGPGPSYRLINDYGMTETAVFGCYFNVIEPMANTPIGKPYSDLEVKIMDDGEICFRGVLTPGYYKDPEGSASLWAGGWLHTGDVGRMLPDGNLEYVNRKDWMVKINGQRVETGEISEVIKRMDGVSDAVAKGFTAPDGHQYVVAYFVADDSVDEAAVKEFAAGKLASYMVPSSFVRMKSLPVNMNGKIDVKSLQSPLDDRFAGSRRIVAPETGEEKALCKAFESALGVSPVSVEDDFFSLGGDSIRVMQLQLSCPQLDLSSSLIYTKRTVRAICAALKSENKASSAPSGDVCPLSKTQSGIFVESMSRRGEAVYNNPVLYRITDPIDADKLSAACVTAVSAHPNLFASIRMDDDGSPVQVKNSSDGFKLEVENVTDVEFAGIRQTLLQPFDILSDRLFRMRVFKTGSAVWLFYDFHHIIFDGTSNSILIGDIEKAYEGLEVRSEDYTGFDLACDEQFQRQTPFFEQCRQWNMDAFSTPDRTSLPDPDCFTDAVSYGKFDMVTGISIHAFDKAAERLGVTENILATGAFGHMLGACTHARDAAFATIYNGRKSLKTARTMSMMVKTLPVYCTWDKSTLVGPYFRQVGDQLVGAMAHDLFSFAEVCAATAYDSRVLFSYQDDLLERDSLCGSKCEMVSLLDNATGEPFAVQLFKSGGVMVIRAEYRSNMYSEPYVRSFISCYKSVLSSLMLSEKDTPLASVQLVSLQESASIVSLGWGKKLDPDSTDTVVDMFRRNVSARPEATAVVDEDGSVTYAQLDSMSDTIASLLVDAGVSEEDFVALMLPRRRHFPASFLACFKCGAAYVPMDCEYPIDRLQYMLGDSGAKVLLTTHEVYDGKSAEGELDVPAVLFVDDILSGAARELASEGTLPRPGGLAYMIYTSGTTGRPKGVMIEHRSLSSMVRSFSDMESLGPDTRIAHHASFSFDGSIPDLMCPLCCGGQLHILPSAIRKDLAAMYRYFCENRIDGIIFSTQIGLTMLRMYDLKLKFMMLGGEKMTGTFNTPVHIYNGYGPTEFTVCSSAYLLDMADIPDNIPIGRPLPNTFSGIVDSCGRLLPRGVVGELVLAGAQLSRGYWHREDITAERFVDSPFLPGEKMYRTGDLAKWDEDGNLLFFGRIDTQIKLRGFRIELGEIESLLSRYDGVKSGVVAVKEIAGVQHLCAYYVSDAQIDREELRSYLAASLTDYMVPTAYVQMEALPMTPNGKVDIKSLPVPEIKAEEIVAPEGELETKLFEIVAEHLKNDSFGVTSNLVSMGLTSLGAITLSLQIERKAGISIPSPKILETPSIRSWAEYLQAASGSAGEAIPTYPKQDVYPLTDNQTGVYIDWEQHKDGIQYNVPMLLHFQGVSADSVADAARAFIGAHPYLKTRLQMVDGKVCQVRNDDASVEVTVRALTAEPDRAFFQSLLQPFDLFAGPLYRMAVFSWGDSVWLLSDVHHIVFDGGSEAIFAGELVRAIGGETISPESFPAFDYALYYRDWKESDEFDKAGSYFTSLLDGTVAATLPAMSGPDGTGSASSTFSVQRAPVTAAARAAGVTENALVLTAVTEVLHRFSRERNIAILTVSSGRSLRALERTCGMFVQTLPVVSHQADRTVGESLEMMHSQIIDTLSRDKYPYTGIVEKTGLKAGILLAYQGDVLGGPLKVGGHDVEMSGLSSDTAKFPLSINVNPGPETVEIGFEYDRSVYGKEDVGSFASAVVAFIQNMVSAGAEAGIGSISCVSAAQGKELVELGSGPMMEVPDGTVVGLFRKQAEAHPDDPAVTDCEGTVTYGQLDKASDLLAGILLSTGLRREDFVSLMLPRRCSFVTAYLAVFKSGGAYVPLDYEYPVDRLQYMVDDSSSRFLVTTRDIFAQKSSEGEFKVDNVIFVDDIDFHAAEAAAPIDNSAPESLAYMIYTSGTTGKPKGVMIEHHSLMNTAAWLSESEKYTRGTRAAEHASFSFDASVLDLVVPIAYGGHLHIIDEVSRKDPEMMYRYLTDHKIEVMAVSTQLGMMLLSSYDLPIRYIMMGGEKLTGSYDRRITVVNGYGPTEFTVCSSYHILDPDRDGDNIPIGKAVPNTVSAVVDPCGCLVPMGVPGELVLIGPQIARGYWNKPDISSRRFVPCPFIEGERMYHTGDLVRWSEDGELLFMGRIDTQVKLRGFRIELGEIESRIATFKDVTAAVARVVEAGGAQHLCAWFTASEKIDTNALGAHLSSILTSYMVPDALIQVETMPLTPNGKVDVKRLPSPELTRASASEFEAPEGELETAIAQVFAQVLGIGTPVGRNSSFFRMGGTSLLVMRVVVMLTEQGHNVTYSDVFRYQTPQALAAFIEGYEAGRETAEPAPAASSPVPEKGEKPSCVTGEDGFDYSAINELLKSNSISQIGSISELDVNPVGDVLLLGSTGYLGIHILHQLLVGGEGKVYCIIRPKPGLTCAGRLQSYLMYYFDDTCADLLDKRIFVIEGDMTDETVMDKLMQIKVDTVINCAANVKHFAAGDEIEKINLNGAETLIDYCLRTGSRLIHTSTHSISGQTEGGEPHLMLESDLYFGQKLMTKYQTSKFAAERAILQACTTKGLRAKIVRLGNLMPRFSDGEFQINIENNGFMARMRAYYVIGCIASEHLHSSLEFAPIDCTAEAILTLARTPDKFTVFHPFNNHTIYIDDVVAVMRGCGLDVKITDAAAFNARLGECLKDEQLNPLITALLAYGSHNNYVMNTPSLDFTVHVLNAMDWRWPVTGTRYLNDSFEKMIALEYFDVCR